MARALLGFFLVALAVFSPVHAQDRLSLQNLELLLKTEKSLVILVRHAQTEAGIGDPPGFRLDDCSTQRNLSVEGRAYSRRMGQWFTSRGLVPSAVRSSQWCRCLDTAKEAFAKVVAITSWPALNSTFQGQGDAPAQHAQIQSFLRTQAQGRASHTQRTEPHTRGVAGFEVWVTHQVVISAISGQYLSMGELVITRPDAQGQLQVLGRFSSDFR